MTKGQLYITVMMILSFAGCSGGINDKSQEVRDSAKTLKRKILAKPGSSYQDSLIVVSPSAIFFNPDSLQMEKIRGVNDKAIFESLTHDCFYQMRNAKLVIERNWPAISVRWATKARWLIFKKADGKVRTVDLNLINDICGIYLFDPSKDPLRTDMTNIDSDLGFYFKKK